MGTKAGISGSKESSSDLEEIIPGSERNSLAFKKETCISSEGSFLLKFQNQDFFILCIN